MALSTETFSQSTRKALFIALSLVGLPLPQAGPLGGMISLASVCCGKAMPGACSFCTAHGALMQGRWLALFGEDHQQFLDDFAASLRQCPQSHDLRVSVFSVSCISIGYDLSR
ncbi:hypothetical protein [Pseudomonas typographi]|uniref:Uncharacterized protein n=1 Tax=Pseudomonas typographi TaxID=2715964 RepID=A0ABR7YXY8_9PSED|nr:hypothetical protein [Pseudomonas typographi]MBD1550507.1 hypothetical protein [Pseudomonas typographi]MBD1587816.1 hypothetical protein [Pseudomonas typographi]MBD1598025.1 hypothetical protein [Pseudomonas typographi]